ncbi:DUF2637 domain-containing protein [Micromonospora cremea]|uniref:DUF2637 domain-containing protein n=1 Tax=Micromonospora cremea TaxID=709881 RepID=A0A1N5TJC8_9ACTN|nr:DUF2637 domain-containing protein [Micromonospora cremea]SIM48384.1 Protein of unknown function [Micromonospora cremea]
MNTAPHTGNPTSTAGAAASADTGAHLRRLRWAVRATLTLGVAASVAAKVLHARPNPISQIIAAWPPQALLLTVELISRVPHHRRSLGTIRIIATAIIAAIATWVSYWHLVGVATRYGETEAAAAYLLPISVDGLVIVASVSLVELTARIRASTGDHRPALIASPESPPAATEPATHVIRQGSAQPSTLAPEQRPAARAEGAPPGTRTRRPLRAVTVPTASPRACGPTAAPDGARQDAGDTADVDSAARGIDQPPQAAAARVPATPVDTVNGKASRSARPHQRSANLQPIDRLDDAQRVDPPQRRPGKGPRTQTDTAEGAVSDGGPANHDRHDPGTQTAIAGTVHGLSWAPDWPAPVERPGRAAVPRLAGCRPRSRSGRRRRARGSGVTGARGGCSGA